MIVFSDHFPGSAGCICDTFPERPTRSSCLRKWLAALICLLFFSGCTTSAWMVAEEPVADLESERVLSETSFFHAAVTPVPQNPVLSLALVKERDLLFNMHLSSERHIQQFRPRYGFMMLGLTGMAAGLYLTNSSVIDADRMSGRERAILNLSSVSIGSASYLTMRRVGDARPAGESRLLQQTGTIVRRDTIPFRTPPDATASLHVKRGEETLVDDRPVPFHGNTISMHIGQETNLRRLSADDTTGLDVRLTYRDVTLEQHLNVRDIMQEYVEVTVSNVPLRTSPATLSGNIISHVDRQSRFPLLGDAGAHWYRILRAEGLAYIRKEHAEPIWMMADTARIGDQVVLPDQMVFGDLEIERNLPDNRRINPDAIAVVIVNGEYRAPVQMLPNARRTTRLVRLYLTQVLGYYTDNIRVYENMTYSQMRGLLQDSDSLMIGGRHLSPNSSDIFFYYYGHGVTTSDNRFYLVPVDHDPASATRSMISLQDLMDVIADMNAAQTVTVLDTDWSQASVYGPGEDPSIRVRTEDIVALRSLVSGLPDNAAVFWAARPGQRAGAYRGFDGRRAYPYDIHTWYFFHGLKDGRRITGDLVRYLERNVPFTSRRLLDRAQDPGFAGNRELMLVNPRPDAQ